MPSNLTDAEDTCDSVAFKLATIVHSPFHLLSVAIYCLFFIFIVKLPMHSSNLKAIVLEISVFAVIANLAFLATFVAPFWVCYFAKQLATVHRGACWFNEFLYALSYFMSMMLTILATGEQLYFYARRINYQKINRRILAVEQAIMATVFVLYATPAGTAFFKASYKPSPLCTKIYLELLRGVLLSILQIGLPGVCLGLSYKVKAIYKKIYMDFVDRRYALTVDERLDVRNNLKTAEWVTRLSLIMSVVTVIRLVCRYCALNFCKSRFCLSLYYAQAMSVIQLLFDLTLIAGISMTVGQTENVEKGGDILKPFKIIIPYGQKVSNIPPVVAEGGVRMKQLNDMWATPVNKPLGHRWADQRPMTATVHI